jgi:hypothetical protein
MMEAEALQYRAQAALLLIQAGWEDTIVADVVGLSRLNVKSPTDRLTSAMRAGVAHAAP